MKREIKFRGKRLDNGVWVYGSLITYRKYSGIWTQEESGIIYCTDVDPETVGQFTGWRDRDGQEIYEGDIVTWLRHRTDGTGFIEQGHVEWRNAENAYVVVNRFTTKDGRELIHNLLGCMSDIKVRGNIHDNPELLGKEVSE